MFQIGFLLSNPALFKIIYTIFSVRAGSTLPASTVIGFLTMIAPLDSRMDKLEAILTS